MAGAHILAHIQVVGKGQHTACSHNDAVPDDNCAVVQGRALVKDGAQHFGDDVSVHRRAGADDLVQVIAAFQHHQGTGAGVGKLFSRIADGNHSALPHTAQRRIGAAVAEQPVRPYGGLAHALQCTAQLRLEDDHRRRKGHGDHVVQYPGDGAQVQQHREAVE